MATHEVPPPSAEDGMTTTPVEQQTREDEPLFVLTLGDVQTVAREELGRALTGDETEAVMDTFRKAFDWAFYVANSIQAGQERGQIGSAVPGYPRTADEPDVAVSEPTAPSALTHEDEFFDIYASLSRDDLEHVGFDTRTVTDRAMHRLAREMTSDYMRQHYWSSLTRIAQSFGIPKHP